MRELGAVALIAGLLAVAGCGSAKTVTVAAPKTTAATGTAASGWGGPTTSPVQLPLPFDSEENAFMGNPDPQHGGLNRTGCFLVVATFDSKSEEVCDCAYRQLRAEGHPASELAAISASINASNNLGPEWFNVAITKCWADLDGSS
jgi:hypothetical protein